MNSGGSSYHNRHKNGINLCSLMLNFRTLTLVVCFILFFILFHYYNESQDNLSKFEVEKDKCQQNLDSISAQFQVVYEHKSRLEKSLQAEKDNNLKYKLEKDQEIKALKENAEIQKGEAEKRIKTIQQRQSEFQTQYDELQLKYTNLKEQLNNLKDEKQSNDAKADEKLKTAQNRIAELERRYTELMNEVEKLRNDNAQLIKTVNEQQLQQQSRLAAATNPPPVLLPNANVAISDTQSVFRPAASLSTELRNAVPTSITTLNNNLLVKVDNIPPPFHQVPDTENQPQQLQNPLYNNNNTSSIIARETPRPLPEVKQIQKPFDDNHQKQLFENANVPLPPGDEHEQPVLQHPLGEDQQNLLGAKPIGRRQQQADQQMNSKNNEIVDNMGHLPVNVRDSNNNDDEGGAVADVQSDNSNVNKVEKIPKRRDIVAAPGPPLAKRGDDDKAKEVENSKRREHNNNNNFNALQHAGDGRNLKEPKDYFGAVGGGGEKDEDDEYRDDEEEMIKKYKESEV